MNEGNRIDEVLVNLYSLQRNIIYDIHVCKAVTKRKKLENLLKDVKTATSFHESKIGINK